MTADNRPDIRVSVSLKAQPERVFDAWLNPAVGAYWFDGDEGEVTRVEMDTREGGNFQLDQQRGEEVARYSGTYLEINRPRHLEFTWRVEGEEGEDRVSVDITRSPVGSDITVTHRQDVGRAEDSEHIKQGWKTMLAGLARGL